MGWVGGGGRFHMAQVETWFKETMNTRDPDPSGVLARAEGYGREAARLNMTYRDYVNTHVKRPIVPTVQVGRPDPPPSPPPPLSFSVSLSL